MTNKELQKQLAQFPDNAQVVIDTYQHTGYRSREYVNSVDDTPEVNVVILGLVRDEAL